MKIFLFALFLISTTAFAGPGNPMFCNGNDAPFYVKFEKAIMSDMIWATVYEQSGTKVATVACLKRSSSPNIEFSCRKGIDERYNNNVDNFSATLTAYSPTPEHSKAVLYMDGELVAELTNCR